MTDSDLKRLEEKKRDAAMRRDPAQYWRDVNAWLNTMEASLPPDRRKDTPKACRAREARILATLNRLASKVE